MILHQFEVSPYCDKVRRILHWKRLPYQINEVPLARALRAVRRINPAGKLPCLEDGGRVIADSTDIALYPLRILISASFLSLSLTPVIIHLTNNRRCFL